MITYLYRLIPPRIRGTWVRPGGSSSHIALRQIVAGGGWSAFCTLGRPRSLHLGDKPSWFPESS